HRRRDAPRVGGDHAPRKAVAGEVAPAAAEAPAIPVMIEEVADPDEVPVPEAAPAAARPAVEAEAEAGEEVAVEAGIEADRAPAGVTRPPVPVHPRRREGVPGLPRPAVGRQIVPGAVVIGHPAPGLRRDPELAARGGIPMALPVRRPAAVDAVRLPVVAGFGRDPGAVALER